MAGLSPITLARAAPRPWGSAASFPLPGAAAGACAGDPALMQPWRLLQQRRGRTLSAWIAPSPPSPRLLSPAGVAAPSQPPPCPTAPWLLLLARSQQVMGE